MEDLLEEARRALDGVLKGRSSLPLVDGVLNGREFNSDISSSLSDVSRNMGRRVEDMHLRDDRVARHRVA